MMILSKFEGYTQGPWYDYNEEEWIYEPKRLLEETADASLIASAPEILEHAVALTTLLREAKECLANSNLCLEAITSRPEGPWSVDWESTLSEGSTCLSKLTEMLG